MKGFEYNKNREMSYPKKDGCKDGADAPCTSHKGCKYDDNKLRWDLLPLDLIEEIVRVYTVGATKYGDNNWQDLEDGYRRYKAAMFRHLVKFEQGEEIDPETGCKHLAQVAWNAIAMLYFSVKDLTVPTFQKHLQNLLGTPEEDCSDVKNTDRMSIVDVLANNYADPVDAFAPAGEKETIEAAKRSYKVLKDEFEQWNDDKNEVADRLNNHVAIMTRTTDN